MPADQARPAKGSRIKAILAVAHTIETQLPAAASSKESSPLLRQIQDQVHAWPECSLSKAADKYEELDRVGTVIWNLCTRLRRNFDSNDTQDIPPILFLARVYGFLLLDSAHESGKSNNGNIPRLMKVGIKAAKGCLERKEYNLAEKVLSKVSAYTAAWKKPEVEFPPDEKKICERLLPEYYVLRAALSWHTGDLKMAGFMFEKSTSERELFTPSTLESLADVLYEIGKDLLEKERFAQAETWLGRAYGLLNGPELDRLSMDANELRVSIMQSLVKTHMAQAQALNSSEQMDEARNMVALLETEVGDKLLVLLLKLELLSHPQNVTFDDISYSDVLQRMVRTIILNNSNFKLIMFHIRQLNTKSPGLACKALDEFLRMRLVKEDQELRAEWFEKVLITRLWITTRHGESSDIFISLDETFSGIAANISKPISPGATLAAHTLLWKNIESSYIQGQYKLTEKWCRLAMHPIFESSGELNIAKISRKMLLCALARTDIGSAREIFNSMSETSRSEPMTRFLMYRIALRCQETELASECLQIISNSTNSEPALLHACCLDAQQVGNKLQTLAVLQLVLEKYAYAPSSTVHLPSLIRLTIGLMDFFLHEALASDNAQVQDTSELSHGEVTVEKLCKLFEGAIASLHTSRRTAKTPDSIWTTDELHWFSKNSYNIAIKHLSTWNPQFSLRILLCCIVFIDAFPEDVGEQILEDLWLRKMFCEFSAATALVTMARGEDVLQTQMQYYLDLHKHVDSFDKLLQEKLQKLDQDAEEDLNRKLAILLAFDFEAACRLKDWPRLGGIIFKAETCPNSQLFEIMADCILSVQPPTHDLITILKKILNAAWVLPSFDSVNLAKYMRCLFQIAIVGDVVIAEQLLDQVQAHADEATENNIQYPSEELEWIATRAFNHSVDLYCHGDDDGCHKWAGKAINIAHYCEDEGALERLLQTKLMSLQFDAK